MYYELILYLYEKKNVLGSQQGIEILFSSDRIPVIIYIYIYY